VLIKGRWLLTLNAAMAMLAWNVETRPAFAQRAAENAVAQADDAFGTSVGNEQVGLYSPRNVRGFSPTDSISIR
jgi:iron complex outermembrane receptor protein